MMLIYNSLECICISLLCILVVYTFTSIASIVNMKVT